MRKLITLAFIATGLTLVPATAFTAPRMNSNRPPTAPTASPATAEPQLFEKGRLSGRPFFSGAGAVISSDEREAVASVRTPATVSR